MNPPALPLGEERYTPTDGAEIVSGDQARKRPKQGRLVARVGGAGPRPPMAEAAGDRYNLLVILGQFVSHFVSARISDVSGILIHRFCIRKNMLYQLCISDVSVTFPDTPLIHS